MTVAAALGMVDQETVMIGCIPQKQSAVKNVGLLHTTSRDHIGSDAAQPLARSFMGHPLGMHPPVPSMEIGVDTTQPLPSTHSSLATDLKWSESQVIPSRHCIPCLVTRQRLSPSIRTDNFLSSLWFLCPSFLAPCFDLSAQTTPCPINECHAAQQHCNLPYAGVCSTALPLSLFVFRSLCPAPLPCLKHTHARFAGG